MIFPALSTLAFMQPIILTALLALPLLWYILRITPPAPRSIFFPATRFIMGLRSEETTASKTPWWILLLRILIAALVILALARPVLNPAESLGGNSKALRVIMDNSWASASTWQQQKQAAEEAITQAKREDREVFILPTTATIGENSIKQYGPAPASDALAYLRGMKPHAWPADYALMQRALEDTPPRTTLDTLWLSHGLNEGRIQPLVKALQSQGSLHIVTPDTAHLPLLLRPASQRNEQASAAIDLDFPRSSTEGRPVTVQVRGENNDILDVQKTELSANNRPVTISFDLAEQLNQTISRYQISGNHGAGGRYILDDRSKKKSVGIVSAENTDNAKPLIDAQYYINRALEPYANIEINEIDKLIEAGPAVIILPDIAAMPAQTLNALTDWVNKGGVLLRFAGPNMAQSRSEPFLLPVHLRAGERALSGTLSWDEPQSIAPFDENSPFYSLDIPSDITIRQQVLADPAQDLDGKVWARLSDGTPLITASREDKGLIVLIHTTANTAWSDLPLSGLYMSVLKRIIRMAGQSDAGAETNYTSLDPLLVMDGYGALVPPPPSVKPLDTAKLDTTKPSATTPPGIYGKGSMEHALNLGDTLPALSIIEDLPLSVGRSEYASDYEISLSPYILFTALILFCVDWLIMMCISGSLLRFRNSVAAVALLLLITPISANAQNDIAMARGFHLAYIETGDQAVDMLSARGLSALSETLAQRTSVEPIAVIGLNPESDTLAFYPLIYWPITEGQEGYSDKAMQRIQAYLDHGGTILFDTRNNDQSMNSPSAVALRRITSSLNIPPIAPIVQDHVLTRSYYLLKDFPGRYNDGTLWVEKQSVSGRDNVSSVIIGSNDWIGAWADSSAQQRFGAGGRNAQGEMPLRFGINLVMYALTGNYKADQVHIPHILERLGE